MEQFKGGEQDKRRQRIIDNLLVKANKKAAEILRREPKLPEEKLRPVFREEDPRSRMPQAELEHVSGMQIVEKEETSGDNQTGDEADKWLNEHDPERRKGKQEGTV